MIVGGQHLKQEIESAAPAPRRHGATALQVGLGELRGRAGYNVFFLPYHRNPRIRKHGMVRKHL